MKKYKIKLPISERLFWILGNQNLNIGRAIAEFIDNSYDARLGSTKVTVEILEEMIRVIDSSSGMNLEDLTRALTPAESRERSDSVGGYGFGLKTASAFLGDCLEILTTTKDMTVSLYVKLENPFEKPTLNKANLLGVWEIEVSEVPKTFEHGTIISVSDLKRPRHKNDIEKVKSHFSKTFSKFIQHGSITLVVNDIEIEPYKFDKYWETKFEFSVPNKNGEVCGVNGWVGVSKSLLKATTSETENGFHLYLNGRLLDYNKWIGVEFHAEMRLLIGEMHLHNFKSNITKTEIISDSHEYLIFLETFSEWFRTNKIRSLIHAKTKEWTSIRNKLGKTKGDFNNGAIQTPPSNPPINMGANDINPNVGTPSAQPTLDKDGATEPPTIHVSSDKDKDKDKTNIDNTPISIVRGNSSNDFELSISIKRASWKIIFKENGKSNQFCDINHHNREITLDSNHSLCERYIKYVKRNGQNYSKHVLFFIFTLFNEESFGDINQKVIDHLNDIIKFRGE
ncbi:hypothetical protein Elgi_31690 [Paenibacillus elgii]|uniref:ATP-binding protein n=1 Tax=Paenibacillus elgii TaxID=189691 RepID=UPI002D7D2AF5|nr:hypothetical protein Elgi_31690 [Paenibacillus elgii]